MNCDTSLIKNEITITEKFIWVSFQEASHLMSLSDSISKRQVSFEQAVNNSQLAVCNMPTRIKLIHLQINNGSIMRFDFSYTDTQEKRNS
ncbi:hypothetical protein WN51_07082 [Melipona quadrifasciata]|uniref:Uncharacterized protein n=1 Tax=Melipona quadrifasciata TaxID=166423 RepID=A0A0N0U361_9HYME|nr:hypothetical protein WN51_07082 [Melipona quadrifasciata]